MKNSRFLSVMLAAAMSFSAMTALSAPVSAEWVKTTSGYSYKSDSTGKKLTGWQTIDGGKYYFDKNGTALTGWKKISGNTYYFNGSKKGKMLTSWAKVGGDQYYFGSDGVMRTGMMKISGKTYYFGSDGVMRTGKIKLNGKSYDFGTDGALKTGTASSSSSKINLDRPMKGLKFGMTKKQVIENMPYKNYAYWSGMIAAETGVSDVYALYALDAKGKLCGYGYLSNSSSYGKKQLAKIFTDNGWEKSANIDGYTYYFSPDESDMGMITEAEGGYMLFVYSEGIMKEIIGGNTGALDHLAGK